MTRRKSSPTSNLAKIISSSFKFSTIILLSHSQDRTCFQKTKDILQGKSKCSMDSTSVWQKAHLSDSAISKRKSFSFVNTIRFTGGDIPLHKPFSYVPLQSLRVNAPLWSENGYRFRPNLVWNRVRVSRALRTCLNAFIVSIPKEQKERETCKFEIDFGCCP